MKPKYSAKVYFENGEFVKNFGNELDELVEWMKTTARSNRSYVMGQIIDNVQHRIISSMQFSPFDE